MNLIGIPTESLEAYVNSSRFQTMAYLVPAGTNNMLMPDNFDDMDFEASRDSGVSYMYNVTYYTAKHAIRKSNLPRVLLAVPNEIPIEEAKLYRAAVYVFFKEHLG